MCRGCGDSRKIREVWETIRRIADFIGPITTLVEKISKSGTSLVSDLEQLEQYQKLGSPAEIAGMIKDLNKHKYSYIWISEPKELPVVSKFNIVLMECPKCLDKQAVDFRLMVSPKCDFCSELFEKDIRYVQRRKESLESQGSALGIW